MDGLKMIIENISDDEFVSIDEELIEYNASKTNLAKNNVFDSIYKCAKLDGKIVGGISGDVELLSALHIKILWVDESTRRKSIGSNLLKNLEDEALKRGAIFSYLETYDFQAKDFYLKNGYEIFSCLKYPTGNVLYFMKKQLV